MTVIRDGAGDGYLVRVNSSNRLKASATTASIEHSINHEVGQAYNLLFEVTSSGSDAVILYMKNTSTTLDMVIEGIYLYVSQACELCIRRDATGTPVGGSDVVPANLNAGSNKEAVGIFQQGSAITGVDGTETTMFKYKFTGASSTKFYNFDQDIIVSRTRVITIECDTTGTLVSGMFPFNYHNTDTHE